MADMSWTRCILLAEDAAQAAPEIDWTKTILFFVPLIFLFWLLLIRPQRRDQQRRQTMLSALKANDHVMTAGGIYGVVTNVHREADVVTIKVDETNNTKLRVSLAAIARVLAEAPPSEPAPK
jgi:preprotein translocase subunit YajC